MRLATLPMRVKLPAIVETQARRTPASCEQSLSPHSNVSSSSRMRMTRGTLLRTLEPTMTKTVKRRTPGKVLRFM
ncbi:hypothetical protein GBAR_LOCUS22911 [Geodia barretti]|uniref:Uncharacterized protein n=1 Tax=Geodia barretti TaxID=519541 RepID=A0AA35X6B1_GEOBA|nr:hypothetical protein GBAR_LOCUS22911 [Geodia barretti]